MSASGADTVQTAASTAVALPAQTRHAPAAVSTLAMQYAWRALPRIARIAHGVRPRKGAATPTLQEQVAAFREVARVAFHGAATVERTEVRARVEATTKALTTWGREHNIPVEAMQDLLARLATVWR